MSLRDSRRARNDANYFKKQPPANVTALISSVRQILPGIDNSAGDSARRDGRRRGEKYLAFLVAHAARKVAVGGANALHRRIHATEGVHRTAEAGGATGILGHLHAGVDKDLPDGLAVPARALQ